MRSRSATEVPPNFITSRAKDVCQNLQEKGKERAGLLTTAVAASKSRTLT
jgi:hypothetical protein